MERIVLRKYGSSFMSIAEFDLFFLKVKKDLNYNHELLIDLREINVISPSFMTRFINELYSDLNYKKVDIINANSRLKTTFNFAQHSIKIKATC